MSTRTIDPTELKGDAVRHLLNAAVAPRPIGWISSLAPNGKVNIAPHSYTTIFALNPPVIGFVSSGRKDTLNNVEAIGDFVYHISGVELANELNLTSANFPPEISEAEWTNLTPVPSDLVRTPRILEAPIAFETKLVQVQEILTSNSFLVLGQVVKIHVSEAILTGDRIDPAKLLPIARLAGNQYSYLGELFSMVRPTYADLRPGQPLINTPCATAGANWSCGSR